MSQILQIAGSFLVVLSLVSCVRYHAEPLAPEITAAHFESRSLEFENLHAFLATNGLAGEWPRRAWDLDALTLVSFYYSPDLEVARAEWATADAACVSAGERPNPSLGFSPVYNTSSGGDVTPWILGLDLDLPLEINGQRGRRLERAQQLAFAARLRVLDAAWQTRSQLRQAFVDLWSADERERLLEEQLAWREQSLKIVEARFAAGEAAGAELSAARRSFHAARMAMRQASGQQSESRVALAQAMGLPVRALSNRKLDFMALERLPPELEATEARQQAALHRADVLSALAEYTAAEAALRAEVARQYPDFNLGPGYEYDQGDHKWGVGIGFTLPVFNRNRGAIAEAQAHRQEAAARFESVQARALAEVDRNVAACEAARDKLSAAEAALAEMQKQEQILRSRLEAGDVSRQELLGAQLDRVGAELDRLETAANLQQVFGALESAVQYPHWLEAAPLAAQEGINP